MIDNNLVNHRSSLLDTLALPSTVNPYMPLKSEIIIAWVKKTTLAYITTPDGKREIIIINRDVSGDIGFDLVLKGKTTNGYRLISRDIIPCELSTDHVSYSIIDEKPTIVARMAAFLFKLESETPGNPPFEVVALEAIWSEEGHSCGFASVPSERMQDWYDLEHLFASAHDETVVAQNKITVIGSDSYNAFKVDIGWDDIILPHDLKTTIMEDIESFFTDGVDIYARLKLKPFRKIMLAGVPGTGKTMLCSAIANWGLSQNYGVIYISSADRDYNSFSKIHEAVQRASQLKRPAIIIVEELDTYIQNPSERSQVLNVLDGSESEANPKGTLMITTTNYPEAIDERIFKRPGRIDRIFIIPDIQDEDVAERVLRHYLGSYWQNEHAELASLLIGQPVSFVREMVIYSLTVAAYNKEETISTELLAEAIEGLKAQMEINNDFLKKPERQMSFNNGSHDVLRAAIPYRKAYSIGSPSRQVPIHIRPQRVE